MKLSVLLFISVVSYFPNSLSKETPSIPIYSLPNALFLLATTNRFSSCVLLLSKLQVCKTIVLFFLILDLFCPKGSCFYQNFQLFFSFKCSWERNHIAQLKKPGLPSGNPWLLENSKTQRRCCSSSSKEPQLLVTQSPPDWHKHNGNRLPMAPVSPYRCLEAGVLVSAGGWG